MGKPDPVAQLSFAPADRAALADLLYARGVCFWETTVAKEARRWGYRVQPRLTNPEILARIRERADQASGWITDHFNAALEKEAHKGGADLPHLKQWANRRAGWKAKQIAVTESAHTANWALLDFYRKNKLPVQVWVRPVGAACVICKLLSARQPYTVGEAAALMGKLPAHVNCPHTFVFEPTEGDKGRSAPPDKKRGYRWSWPIRRLAPWQHRMMTGPPGPKRPPRWIGE